MENELWDLAKDGMFYNAFVAEQRKKEAELQQSEPRFFFLSSFLFYRESSLAKSILNAVTQASLGRTSEWY